MGSPFQVKNNLNFNTIKKIDLMELKEEEHLNDQNYNNIHNTEYEEVSKITEEILDELNKKGEKIIKEANNKANGIIESSKKEALEFAETVFEEEKIKGFEAGYQEAKKQYEDLILEAEFIKEHARTEYRDVLASIESDAINVILNIAKNVINMEISLNKEELLFLVKEAFDKCASKENIILKVSSHDYDYLFQNKNKILSMVEGIGELEIKKDP